MKKAVLFDVDDTLYDQTVPFKEAYSEYFGPDAAVPADELYPVSRKYSNQVFARAMSGEMSMEEMYIYRMQKAFEEFGVKISDEDALGFQYAYVNRQRNIHMTPLMRELLAWCSGRAPLGIITNGPSGHQWDKVKGLKAEQWIPRENVFISAEVGAAKPDRAIFDLAARRMKAEEAQKWFVGDAYELDIEGAMNAGWKTVWINRRGNLRPDGKPAPEYEVRSEEELFAVMQEVLDSDRWKQ